MKKIYLISVICILFFLCLSTVCAADTTNSTATDSYIVDDQPLQEINSESNRVSNDNNIVSKPAVVSNNKPTSPTILGNSSDAIYVAVDGQDSIAGGSEDAPLATIQFAINHAPVDGKNIIIIKNGTYKQHNINISFGYTSPLTFIGQGNVTIDGENNSIFRSESKYPLTFENINFINANKGGQYPATSVIYAKSDISLINCSLRNNNASSYEIYNLGGNTSIVNCKFENNYNDIMYTHNTVIVNSSFINNNANGNLIGLHYIDDFNLSIINSTFVNNSMGINNNFGNVSIINSSFIGENIGKIVADNISLINSTFKNSTTDFNLIGFNKNGYVNNCSFINITPKYREFIIKSDYGNGSLIGCEFINVTSYCFRTRNNTFVSNSTFMNTYLAISSRNNVTISNCSFVNTSSYNGGAINGESNFTISNCSFVNTSASRDGGAICVNSSSKIENCSFLNTFANYTIGTGGSIFTTNSTIINSSFTNTSAYNGGAITRANNSVINCTFKNNNEIGDFVIIKERRCDGVGGYDKIYPTFLLTFRYFGANSIPGFYLKDTDYHHCALIFNRFYKEYYPLGSSLYSISILGDSDHELPVPMINITDGVWFYNKTVNPFEIVQFDIEFDFRMGGNFTNTAYGWYENGTVYNSTDLVHLSGPGMVVDKSVVGNSTVYLGDNVTFTITVNNTGNSTLSDVFVDDFCDSTLIDLNGNVSGNWFKLENGTWMLNGTLASGECSSFNLTFMTTAVGTFKNIASAISNDTPICKDSANITVVVKTTPNSTDNHTGNHTNNTGNHTNDNQTGNHSNDTVSYSSDVPPIASKVVSSPVTGNPLYILLMAILALIGIPIRRKK